jgi:hypothetical protein
MTIEAAPIDTVNVPRDRKSRSRVEPNPKWHRHWREDFVPTDARAGATS